MMSYCPHLTVLLQLRQGPLVHPMPTYYLMHGKLDTVAPAKNTVELAEALRHLGVRVATSYLLEGHSQLVVALMSERRHHYKEVHGFVLQAIQSATSGESSQ